MHRLRVIFAIFAALICLIAGCGAPAGQAVDATGDAVSLTPAAAATPAVQPGAPLTREDLCIVLNGEVYPLMRDIAPLLEALGEPASFTASQSCVFTGEDKSYEYAALGLYTNPDGDRDIVYEALLYDATAATLRGVRVGDARANVEAAYGAPVIDGRYLCYYAGDKDDLSAPRILFEMTEDGAVKSIDVYNPTNITDG